MKDQVKKSLSLVGKKIKSFILIDIGETRKKRFLDLFWWIFIKKNNFFFQSYFFGKLDMQTKNYNFRMHKGSKTPKIDFFTYGFFVGIQLLDYFFWIYSWTQWPLGFIERKKNRRSRPLIFFLVFFFQKRQLPRSASIFFPGFFCLR